MKRPPVDEMFYLPTRDYSYEISHAKRERLCQILLALILIAFIAVFIADNLLGMTVAHAETTQPVHDNAYYCQEWKNGEIVMGASSDEITKLCDNLK